MTAERIYERVVVDRPRDANLIGPIRAKAAETVSEMDRLHRAGVSTREIARRYGVSVRTVYRYLADPLAYVDVVVGGWVATFATSSAGVPRRVTTWRPAS